jgi:hypothetical protein
LAADAGAETMATAVKAAYLSKFADYVEWPSSAQPQPGEPFTIGVIGENELAAELDRQLAGRSNGDHPIVVRLIRPNDSLAGVQILFIGLRKEALRPYIETLRAQSILTVTEAEGALGAGSVVNFVLVDNHLRFEISLDAAERRGLRLSSRLLAVAQQVQRQVP